MIVVKWEMTLLTLKRLNTKTKTLIKLWIIYFEYKHNVNEWFSIRCYFGGFNYSLTQVHVPFETNKTSTQLLMSLSNEEAQNSIAFSIHCKEV